VGNESYDLLGRMTEQIWEQSNFILRVMSWNNPTVVGKKAYSGPFPANYSPSG